MHRRRHLLAALLPLALAGCGEDGSERTGEQEAVDTGPCDAAVQCGGEPGSDPRTSLDLRSRSVPPGRGPVPPADVSSEDVDALAYTEASLNSLPAGASPTGPNAPTELLGATPTWEHSAGPPRGRYVVPVVVAAAVVVGAAVVAALLLLSGPKERAVVAATVVAPEAPAATVGTLAPGGPGGRVAEAESGPAKAGKAAPRRRPERTKSPRMGPRDLLERGLARWRKKDARATVRLLEKARRGDPRLCSEACYTLGLAYERLGRKKKALQAYKAFLKTVSPGDPRSQRASERVLELQGL